MAWANPRYLGEAYKQLTDVDPREQMMFARTRTVECKMVLDIKTVLNYFDEAAAVNLKLIFKRIA
jgi:hypothetical protein